MVGVALACYGETAQSVIGFVVTCMCVILAALKVVLSGEMLTGDMKVRAAECGALSAEH